MADQPEQPAGSFSAEALKRLLEATFEEGRHYGRAQVFREQLDATVGMVEHPKMPFNSPIAALDLDARPHLCLEREGVRFVWQLFAMNKGNFLDIRNFGDKSLDNVRIRLGKFGYAIKGEKPLVRKAMFGWEEETP